MSYSIGIDYGTASGRVILVDTSNGEMISSYEETYEHGTIAETLNGEALPRNYFLQNADDYLHVLENGVKYVLEEQSEQNDVLGIGVDFTSCTIVFLDENFEPLHRQDRFKTIHTPMLNYGNIMALKMKRHKWLKPVIKHLINGSIITVQASIVNG